MSHPLSHTRRQNSGCANHVKYYIMKGLYDKKKCNYKLKQNFVYSYVYFKLNIIFGITYTCIYYLFSYKMYLECFYCQLKMMMYYCFLSVIKIIAEICFIINLYKIH